MIKATKVWKTKIKAKNQGNKQRIVTHFVGINPTISIINLNVSVLNLAYQLKRQIVRVDQKTRPNYVQETLFKYKKNPCRLK